MIPFVVKSGDLYYNTLTGKLVKTEGLSKGLLLRNGFLDDSDPDELVESIRKPMKRGNLSQLSTATIFTTTDCNAKCSYCYEKGIRRRGMNLRTASDIAEWIANRSNDIRLRWFGGEPLLNREAIDKICNSLKILNVKYTSSITTNGRFLDRIPMSWHLKKAQVTIDGTNESYKKEKGISLDLVLDNIRFAIADGVKITVRMNVSNSNVSDLLELCDILTEFPGLKAYANILFEDKPNYVGVNLINQRLLDLDICADTKLPMYKDGYCMADQGHAVCINPEGNLTLCEHHCDDEIFGSIYDNNYDWDLISKWREFEPQTEECKTCFYRPICHKLIKCHSSTPCTEEYRAFRYKEIQQKMRAIEKAEFLKRKVGKNNGGI